MFSVPSQFRLALIPLSVLLAYSATASAQQTQETQQTQQAKEETDKKKPKQAAPANLQTPAPAVQKVQVSGAKGYDERRQDTASKIVVTQEDIVRYGDTNIGDVLKRLPGVTIGGVQGRGGAIRMRGLGAGYTQIMLNGEPSPPGFSLDSISPDNIERIEVIRAATAELSTQSIAGAINIVLKKAIVTAQREVKFGMSEENGKYGVNASLQLSDKVGKLSYSVSGNLMHGEFGRPDSSTEVRTGADPSTNYVHTSKTESEGKFQSLGISPRINWMLENGDMLTSQSFANINRFTNRNVQTTQTNNANDALLFLNETSKNASDSSSIRSNLTYVHKLADSAKLDMRFGANYNQRDGENILIAQTTKQILNRSYISESTDNGFTYGGKYTAPFVEDHALAAGWDGGFSKRSDTAKRDDVLTDTSNIPGPIRPNSTDESYGANVNRLALFVQDEWNYSKALSIYAGVRWEGIDTKSSGNKYAEIKNRSSVLSPILQTLYKIPGSKNDQVRLGITRTYKAPDTGRLIPRLFTSSNNSETNPDSMGNPNLKPELAWGLDTGFEHYLTDGGILSVNFFMRRIEDFTRISVEKYIDKNGELRYVSMPTNSGLANTRGVEFDAKFPLRTLMEDAPAIDFRANLAFNSSTVNSVPGPNNRLDSQTPVSANFGMDYKLDDVPLTLGGNLSFQNAGMVRISANQSSYGIPKRVLDVYALWKFGNQTNLRVALGNALHQDNMSSSTYTDASGSIVRTNISQTHLALRVNFEHKF
ncbi:TonB-dependent receptor plug domain-containing protein [Undibacterium flavidum]|uniref:TonB-dependent receptor n=1 Tax=Undibacterium flavidum TaxID=2762297 RepID=A0ABR6Y6C1_9BURK|nr:TonB-dependent receptor [Undibacterium flavidum]MBC3872164.1 TonB-dependent receptor [Undibacterium flavidum]